jgi:hypothetical protein
LYPPSSSESDNHAAAPSGKTKAQFPAKELSDMGFEAPASTDVRLQNTNAPIAMMIAGKFEHRLVFFIVLSLFRAVRTTRSGRASEPFSIRHVYFEGKALSRFAAAYPATKLEARSTFRLETPGMLSYE